MTYTRYVLIPNDENSKALLLQKNGTKSVIPLDSYLGLSGIPFKISPEAMIEIAYWAQNQSSYQRAEDVILKVLSINVNDDTLRQVTNFVGGIVFANDCIKANDAYDALISGKLEYPQSKEGVVYIQADGAALNTRIKDETGSSWRENKLGEVFSSDNIHYWTNPSGKREHRILKKEYVSYMGSVEEFKKHLFACALRNGYGQYKETVFLGDGATWIRNIVSELFPDAQQILDYYHLCENVYEYAKALFNLDPVKYKPWALKICDQLKDSQYNEVLKELEQYKGNKLTGCSLNLYGYISNNINNIDYVTYEQRGYFIGSGAIESGNKIVLQDRLKRAGMRWNTDTAQAMLTLKSKVESNLWHTDVVTPFLSYCFEKSYEF